MTDVAVPEPTLQDRARSAAIAKVVADLVTEYGAEQRAGILNDLLAMYRANGVSKIDVKLDGGGKVATISLAEAKDKAVVADPTAFTAWVEEHYESEVDYTPRVRDTWQKAFLDGTVTLNTETGEVLVPDTTSGEVTPVPGLKALKAGEPSSFSLRFTPDAKDKKNGGRQQILNSMADSSIRAILPATAA